MRMFMMNHDVFARGNRPASCGSGNEVMMAQDESCLAFKGIRLSVLVILLK